MTCIVGLVHGDEVFMGADSCVSDSSGNKDVGRGSKLFISGDVLIGGSGTIREMQVIQHDFRPPPMVQDQDPEEYMVCAFTRGMRSALSSCGALATENDQESVGSEWLVGMMGRLFLIDCGFGVVESAHGVSAVGGGAPYAIGSLHATKTSARPADRIRMALQAASDHAAGCSPPFTILTLGDDQ